MIVKKPKLIPPIPTAKIIDHINIFAEQAANDTLLKNSYKLLIQVRI